jgi:hypothetical protein
MRNLLLATSACFATLALFHTSAHAGVMTLSCSSGAAAYELMIDDDRGVMTSTVTATGAVTQLVVRGIKRENGTVFARGYVNGRGTEFEFNYKYSGQISYLFGNGGKRSDDCRLLRDDR